MVSNATAAGPMTRRDLEAKIVALAWKDDAFRKKFLADPKAQFEEKLGTKLPASLKMSAHQEDENSLYFVIPMKPKAIGELSDEDLEKVAGGTDISAGAAISIAILIAALAGGAVGAGAAGASQGWTK